MIIPVERDSYYEQTEGVHNSYTVKCLCVGYNYTLSRNNYITIHNSNVARLLMDEPPYNQIEKRCIGVPIMCEKKLDYWEGVILNEPM